MGTKQSKISKAKRLVKGPNDAVVLKTVGFADGTKLFEGLVEGAMETDGLWLTVGPSDGGCVVVGPDEGDAEGFGVGAAVGDADGSNDFVGLGVGLGVGAGVSFWATVFPNIRNCMSANKRYVSFLRSFIFLM